MTEEQKDRKKANDRRYRERHAEKIKESQRAVNKKWYDANKDRVRSNIKVYRDRVNKESLETATRHSKPWTNMEIRELRRLKAEGLSTKELSRRMGRTTYACLGMLRKKV